MLEGGDGPKVMEVNSSPGLEGIEAASGIDIAGAIIRHIEEHQAFPEFDIRERLTLNSGYGVVETTLDAKSAFVGKSIAETNLRELDVSVLVIERPDTVISNPKATRVLEAGDKLLLFGNRATLKSMVPARRRKKKTTKKGGTA
jgi:ribosomal protein S6--L-glutamate ligase